ncbi:hypothetical protein AB6A40_000441 [Gnathostoma spinigerum]|uniref:Uncharacterized protein n=1 Tax=Gnathostoma spinigerum TaxID=75299 RepID=A0ABD6EB78_9BILA
MCSLTFTAFERGYGTYNSAVSLWIRKPFESILTMICWSVSQSVEEEFVLSQKWVTITVGDSRKAGLIFQENVEGVMRKLSNTLAEKRKKLLFAQPCAMVGILFSVEKLCYD